MSGQETQRGQERQKGQRGQTSKALPQKSLRMWLRWTVAATSSTGWRAQRYTAAAVGTVDSPKGQYTASRGWSEHEVSITHRAGDTNRRVDDHYPDLNSLFVRVVLQPLAAFDPAATVTGATAVKQHRTSCAPPVTERAALGRTAQVGQKTLQSVVA